MRLAATEVAWRRRQAVTDLFCLAQYSDRRMTGFNDYRRRIGAADLGVLVIEAVVVESIAFSNAAAYG